MIYGERNLECPIRWALVGGGRGSQIGYIHRDSALRDQNFRLVAGAFSRESNLCRRFGTALGVEVSRCYSDYQEMFEKEKTRNDGIEAVTIATPNNTHFTICKAALEAGIHVICEKPLCFKIEEAEALKKIAEEKRLIVGVTYGYAGHQILRQAREMIENSELGEIRIIRMQFAHGFHSTTAEKKDASVKWRVDPKVVGPAYVLGDIGTHLLYLSQMLVPKLKIKRLMCHRQSFIKSRTPLEDNAFVLMDYDNGAIGEIWVSAVNAGSLHGEKIRIIGSKASIEWWDEHPNQLAYEKQDEPARILERGMKYLYSSALEDDRMGAGHAEGLFESWANIYKRFAVAIDAEKAGKTDFINTFWFPDICDGIEGVRWINTCVESADAGSIWINY